MPNIHCPNCGSSTKYLYSKPEKCPSCRSAFASVIASNSEPIFQPRPERQSVSILEIPKNKNIIGEVKVDVGDTRPEKFGEIIGTSIGEERLVRQKTSKEEFLRKIKSSETQEIA